MKKVKIPSGKQFKKIQAALDGLGFFSKIERTRLSKKSLKYQYCIIINFEKIKTYKTRFSARKYIYKIYLNLNKNIQNE